LSTQNNKVNFNATTTMGEQQPMAMSSARPQSQKVTIPIQTVQQTSAMNNRNSRKNLRPIGKKGQQHGSSSNLKTKSKNNSREMYMTNNDGHSFQKAKMMNQNQATQNLKGFQSLVQ
jgi:hypothetical protein